MKRVTVIIFALALAGAASAGEWHIETVDSAGNVGAYTSLELDSSDYPHISYYDAFYANLKYARWDGDDWQIETVDYSTGSADDTSLALDSSNHPHIAYRDSRNGYLKYARWDGDEWQIEIVDRIGRYGGHPSLVMDTSDYPLISYYDYTNRDLKYARWDGDEWQIETVDSDGWVGEWTSLALDSDGYPHISYHLGNPDYDVRYARWDGDEWQIETVESEGWAGQYISLALDSSDYPHISYSYYNDIHLNYAHWDGDEWQIETVDSSGNAGPHNSLALDSSDYPHISYQCSFTLRYARWDGSDWQIETVDPSGYAGWFSSLALDSSDYPCISYFSDDYGDLKYAWYDDESGVEEAEIAAGICDEGVLVGWEITGDVPAGVRVLRSAGEDEPVAVSGPLPGSAVRWLDTDAYDASDKGLKPLAYWLEVTEEDGTTRRFGPSEAVNFPGPARELALDVYPSPAADLIMIDYTLPEGASVTLALYDLAGRRVDTLVDAETTAGRHEFVYDASALLPGVYLAHLVTETATLTRRVVIAR
jgi:hypothetical protein